MINNAKVHLESLHLLAAITAALAIPAVAGLACRARRALGAPVEFVPLRSAHRVRLVWAAPLGVVAGCWLVFGLRPAPLSAVGAYLILTGAAVAWTAACNGGHLNLSELELRDGGLCHGLWTARWTDILEYTWQPGRRELIVVTRRGSRVFRINARQPSEVARSVHASVSRANHRSSRCRRKPLPRLALACAR